MEYLVGGSDRLKDDGGCTLVSFRAVSGRHLVDVSFKECLDPSNRIHKAMSSQLSLGSMRPHGGESLAAAWRRFLDLHHHPLSQHGGWELRFAREVLTRVEGLTPGMVQPQYSFYDANGKRRYIDFAILEGNAARGDVVLIAVEVDGYDKTGTGTGPTRAAMADWLERQNALTQQGWRVLRFLNSEFAADPARAARMIAATLTDARAATAARAAVHARGSESTVASHETGTKSVPPTQKRYRILTATTAGATGMLILGLLPLPSTYYLLLRWAVTGAACVGVIQCATRRVSWGPVALLFLATIYNPIAPLYLGSRQVWRLLNLITAVVLVSVLAAIKEEDIGQS